MKFENLTLPQLMLLWGSLNNEVDRVAELIENQVLQLKQTQVVGDIRATYGLGRGSFNYQKIAKSLEAEHRASYGVFVTAHTAQSIIINWRAICEEFDKSLNIEGKQKLYALQKEHFTPGKEQVRLSVDKPKEPKLKEDK